MLINTCVFKIAIFLWAKSYKWLDLIFLGKDHCVGPVRKNLGYFWVQEELTRQGYRLLDMKLVATLA